MSAYIDVQVTHDLLEYLALGDRTVIQGDHFGNALKREADLSGLPYRRSGQICASTTRASELVSRYARIFEAQMEGRANLLELISADAAKPDNISQRVLI
jgi:hypothetical protein